MMASFTEVYTDSIDEKLTGGRDGAKDFLSYTAYATPLNKVRGYYVKLKPITLVLPP